MRVLTFGEIMLRLTPSKRGELLRNCGNMEVNFAGSESNVATSLAALGHEVSFVTVLPKNDIGLACKRSLNSHGIDTSKVQFADGRLGTYFIEAGSSIRPSKVVYDREYSVFSLAGPEAFDWPTILEDKDWIFVSGITAALSKNSANSLLSLLASARKVNTKIAFDMNYRRTLWKNVKNAKTFFQDAIKYVDLLFGNIGLLEDLLDFKKQQTKTALITIAERFDLQQICFTDRKHHSASLNELQGFFYSEGEIYQSSPITVDITDRFGTGDAFAAGCLHGFFKNWPPEKIIPFGSAAFALKHTIAGDQHLSSERDILAISEGNTTGHVLR
ncbi:MAG: sugar kinase [Bacteroidota bacterium]